MEAMLQNISIRLCYRQTSDTFLLPAEASCHTHFIYIHCITSDLHFRQTQRIFTRVSLEPAPSRAAAQKYRAWRSHREIPFSSSGVKQMQALIIVSVKLFPFVPRYRSTNEALGPIPVNELDIVGSKLCRMGGGASLRAVTHRRPWDGGLRRKKMRLHPPYGDGTAQNVIFYNFCQRGYRFVHGYWP